MLTERIRSILLCFVTLAFLLAGLWSPARAATKITLGHAVAATDPRHEAGVRFGKELERLTNGRYVVEVYPGGQLGNYNEQVQAIKVGTQDILIEDTNVLDRFDTIAGIDVYPFLFRDADHFFKVFNGAVGKDLYEEIRKKTGFLTLGAMFRGYRELTTKRPVTKVDDLKGMKIRVPPAKIFLETWKALGANPTPMVWGEVYLSLKQGVIDAQENPFPVIYNEKIFEVTKYLVLTHHATGVYTFIMNDKKFQSYPRDVQDAFRAAAKVGEEYYNQYVLKEQAQLLDELKKKGMEVLTPDLSPFRERVKALDDQFPEYKPWLARIRGL